MKVAEAGKEVKEFSSKARQRYRKKGCILSVKLINLIKKKKNMSFC